MGWQGMETYRPGTRALFWVDDGTLRYMVFGVVETMPSDGVPRVWDDNGFGFAEASFVRAWVNCSPPAWLMH